MFRKLRLAAVVTGVVTATLLGGTASAQAATVSSVPCKGTVVTSSVSAAGVVGCGAQPMGVRWQ